MRRVEPDRNVPPVRESDLSIVAFVIRTQQFAPTAYLMRFLEVKIYVNFGPRIELRSQRLGLVPAAKSMVGKERRNGANARKLWLTINDGESPPNPVNRFRADIARLLN